MDNQKPDSQQACCAHVQVSRFQIENAGRVFEEQWRCKDCGAKFVNLDSFFAGPQRIEVMEPMATLRDQFAMAALIARQPATNPENAIRIREQHNAKEAKMCYEMADAMLEARKQ